VLKVDADTKFLARVDLSKTHAVEFYQFKGGPIGLREIGQAADAEQRVDFDSLGGKPIGEVYRTLSKDPQKTIPPALEQAALVKPPPSQPTDGPPPFDPPKEPPAPTTGDKVPALATRAPVSGDGTGLQSKAWGQTKKSLDWGDASWWTYYFCQTTGMDSVWCLPDYAWATTGARPTMYYQASGMNMGGSAVASYWIDEWWGYWQRIINEDLYPGWWVSWWFENNRYLASGIAGNDPDWHIHFSERFRNGAPDITQTAVYPYNDAHYWTEELQGATQNGSNWFMASRTNLMRFPITSDLHYYPTANVYNPWSYWWGHMGSPTYGWNNGTVVVPLEPDWAHNGHASRSAFGIFDTSLNGLATPTVPYPPAGSGIPDEQAGESSSNPWIAYNPQDQRYYSSGYNPTWLYAYDIWYSPYNVAFNHAVQILDDWGNPIQLHDVAGGAFSPSGKLYLALDDHSNSDWGQIVVIDVNNGRVHRTYWIERHRYLIGPEEMEGLTFWNSNGTAPGINGQMHLVLLDNDGGQDDWYYKHYTFSGAP
jgi:hypothetical protein